MVPNFDSASSSTKFATAWLLSKAFKSSAVFPILAAYCSVAGLSLNIIPNSSRSSGSAFVTPLTKRLKESVRSLPNTKEAFLAAVPNPVICVALKPAALAIAVAWAASLYFNCPSVASCKAKLIPLKEVPVTAPYCS